MSTDRPRDLGDLGDLLNAIGPPVTTVQLAEMLWLAGHLPASPGEEVLPPDPADPLTEEDEAGGTGLAEEQGDDSALAIAGGAASDSGRQPLHAPGDPADGGGDTGAESLLVPTAPMLNQTLAVQRALRPFKRRVPSSRLNSLDENATAEKIAQRPGQRPWTPVMVPARERWLSLALVVDTGQAMAVWRPLAGELREAMFRLGAFRDVRVWLLTTDRGAKAGVGIRAAAGGPVLAPSALADPTGRQAVAILSDCSGRHWWDGRAGAAVHRWARQGPTAILQPLGEGLWRRTGAPTVPGQAILSRPGAPNTELRFTPHDGPASPPPGRIAVPVTELSADWLADWAKLVAGSGGPRDTAVTYVSERIVAGAEPLVAEEERAPADRVARFQAAASPLAAELAAHLAVTVPYLPVIRLIQHRILPASRPSDLAEVLLSGLLRPVETAPGLYDFLPGARDALLRTLPRDRSLATAAVLEQISSEIQQRAGLAAATFRAVLNTAEGTGSLSADARGGTFALINAEALSTLTQVAPVVPDWTGGFAGNAFPVDDGAVGSASGAFPIEDETVPTSGSAAADSHGTFPTEGSATADPDEAVPTEGSAAQVAGSTPLEAEDGTQEAEGLPPEAGQAKTSQLGADSGEGIFYRGVRDDGRPFSLRLPPRVLNTGWPPPDRETFPSAYREFDRILRTLDPARSEQVPILIEGEAGTGKTFLAARAAQTTMARDWFPGGVLYLRMTVFVDSRSAVRRLLNDLRVPEEYIPSDTSGRFELYRALLAAYGAQDRRILLVIDDAVDSGAVRQILPADSRTGTIITSIRHLDIEPAVLLRPPYREQPVFRPAPGLPPGPRTALVIATGRYLDPALPELPSAVGSADQLADVLADPEIGGFTVNRVYDSSAANLRSEIASLLTTRRRDDTLLFYLSCHVIQDRRGRLFFAAADTPAGRVTSFSALSASDLISALDECPAPRQILILDCAVSSYPGLRGGSLWRQLDTGRHREILGNTRGVNASLRTEQRPTGVTFTELLAESLLTGAADEDRDGLITVREAYSYADTHPASDGDPAGRFQAGVTTGDSTVLARSRVGRAVIPARLPEAIADALENSSPNTRLGALRALEEWLEDHDPARTITAEETLRDIAAHDTASVAEAATELLDRILSQLPSEPPAGAPARSARQASSRDFRGSLTPVVLDRGSDEATWVAFSPDGRQIVSCGGNRPMRLWQTRLPLPRSIGSPSGIWCATFSPDGQRLATGGNDGVVLYGPAASDPVRVAGMGTEVTTIAFSQDSRLLAVGDAAGNLRGWRVGPSDIPQQFLSGAPVLDVAFSPRGDLLAAACGDGSLWAWPDQDAGPQLFARREPGDLSSLAFSPDGTLLAFGGRDGVTLQAMSTGVLQPVPTEVPLTGVELRELDTPSPVRCVAFSPVGSLLAVGCSDGSVGIWRVAAGTLQALFQGPPVPVLRVAFSPVEPMVAAATADGFVRLLR